VIAIPAAIAGKYNRSDQVSFGRGTVTAMIKLPVDKGKDGGGPEDVNEGDLEKEDPAQSH
jgi:hypothetical protein